MGKWVHRLTEVNEEKRRGICQECGPVPLVLSGQNWRCRYSKRQTPPGSRHLLTQINQEKRTALCEKCGPAQLLYESGIWKCRNGNRKTNRTASHRLIRINPEEQTGTCESCGEVELWLKSNGYWQCSNGQKVRIDKPWRKHLESECSRCGFIPEDTCQLDVDHINADKTDNRPENLQTLCANCHRLKTKYERKEKRGAKPYVLPKLGQTKLTQS
jgi:5-methylcytosine-specific restriction endonuclease McrA